MLSGGRGGGTRDGGQAVSIEVIQGDLLDFPAGITVIADGRNAQGVMGGGLALAIKKRYPKVYEAYRTVYERGDLTLGSLIPTEVEDGKFVFGLITQEHYGTDRRHTDYEALYVCLLGVRLSLESSLKQGREHVLGLPHKIGCGLGGGEWSVVSAMIHVLFHDSPIKCVIVQLPPPPNLAVSQDELAAILRQPKITL